VRSDPLIPEMKAVEDRQHPQIRGAARGPEDPLAFRRIFRIFGPARVRMHMRRDGRTNETAVSPCTGHFWLLRCLPSNEAKGHESY